MKKREYRDYLLDIYDSITDIEMFVAKMEYNDFVKDKKTINAVIRSIEVVGEAAKKVPLALRDKHKSIPWKKMSGMRDKLIHEYFGVDLEILWKVITQDVPLLKHHIRGLLKKLKVNKGG
jgi:uncharacterized protein with HEPN domain